MSTPNPLLSPGTSPDQIIQGLDTEAQQRQATDATKIKSGQSEISGIESELDQVQQKKQQLSDQHIGELESDIKKEDQWGGLAPQDQISRVMNQSPLFLAMSALAGGFTRSSSVTALGSMNGMMQGILKGDRQAFDDSQKQYEQQYQVMQDRIKLRDKIFAELKDAYGDSADGLLRRWQIANASIGEAQKDSTASFQFRGEMAKLEAQMQEQHERTQEMRETAAARLQVAQEKVDQTTAKQTAKEKQRIALVDSMDSQIDKIISKIQANPRTTTGAGGTVNRAYNSVKGVVTGKSDTTSTDVHSELEQLQLAAAQYDNAGGHPSQFLIKKIEDIVGGTNLGSNDANTISRLKELKGLIGGERNKAPADAPEAPAMNTAEGIASWYKSGPQTAERYAEATKMVEGLDSANSH